MSDDIDTGAGYQPGTGFEGAAAPGEAGGQESGTGQGEAGEQQRSDQGAGQQAQQPKGDRLTAYIQERRRNRSETDDLRSVVSDLQKQVSGLSPEAKAEAESWRNPHDATEAPMDYLRAEIEHLGGVVNQAKSDVSERLQQQDQQSALNDYERGVQMELHAAVQQLPELAEAHQAVVSHFIRTAQMQGMPPAQAAQQARNALLSSYLQHQQAGRDPVAATVEMAQALGFRASQPAGGNGQGANPQAQAIARGQAAAMSSLGGATGNSGATSPPDLQALTRMSRDQLRADGKKNLERMRAILRGAA